MYKSKSDVKKDYWASKVEPFENNINSEKVEEKKTQGVKKQDPIVYATSASTGYPVQSTSTTAMNSSMPQ